MDSLERQVLPSCRPPLEGTYDLVYAGICCTQENLARPLQSCLCLIADRLTCEPIDSVARGTQVCIELVVEALLIILSYSDATSDLST